MKQNRQNDGVYILHFSTPYHHARHYIGHGAPIWKRVAMHKRGKGSKLTRAVYSAGIEIVLARTFPGMSQHYEYLLKRRKATPRICPICNPQLNTHKWPKRKIRKELYDECPF